MNDSSIGGLHQHQLRIISQTIELMTSNVKENLD
jgi:hypothetical protein